MNPSKNTIDYCNPTTVPPSHHEVVYIGGAIIGFLAAVNLTIYGFARMDADRLLWEGGDAYLIAEFPFITVWTLCGLGAVLSAFGMQHRGRSRNLALIALVLNVCWAGWFVKSYWVSRLSVAESGYPVPMISW